MTVSNTPDPNYDRDYHYELVGGPLDGRTMEMIGWRLQVATNEHGDYGYYYPRPKTGRAYWHEGDDDAPAAAPTPA